MHRWNIFKATYRLWPFRTEARLPTHADPHPRENPMQRRPF
jgi:hypothetical protein